MDQSIYDKLLVFFERSYFQSLKFGDDGFKSGSKNNTTKVFINEFCPKDIYLLKRYFFVLPFKENEVEFIIKRGEDYVEPTIPVFIGCKVDPRILLILLGLLGILANEKSLSISFNYSNEYTNSILIGQNRITNFPIKVKCNSEKNIALKFIDCSDYYSYKQVLEGLKSVRWVKDYRLIFPKLNDKYLKDSLKDNLDDWEEKYGYLRDDSW